MAILRFPNPRNATPEGILALGGDLEPESLILAYRQGIFPWPMDGLPLAWFCPSERAVLEYRNLHIPKSLEKLRRKNPFQFTIDQAFQKVITYCAQIPRPGQDGTWITDEIQEAYCEFHRLGHAHSFEAWKDGKLVGGLYGVDAGGAFAAESMFHFESNASKLVVLEMMDHFFKRGLDWVDIQVLTPHMEKLGAEMISRDRFLNQLQQTLKQNLKLF